MRFLRLPKFSLDLDVESFDTWLRLLVAATSPRLSIDGSTYGDDKLRVYEIKRDGLTLVVLNAIADKETIEIRLVRLPGMRLAEAENITRNPGSIRQIFASDHGFCWKFYFRVEGLGAKFKGQSERYPSGLFDQVLTECLGIDRDEADGHGLIFTELGLADGKERTEYEHAERWEESDHDRPLPITRADAQRVYEAERLLGIPPNAMANAPIVGNSQNGKDRSNSKLSKQPYGWRSDTKDKIDKLRRRREQSRNKSEKEITILRVKACELEGIEPRTVKKYAPELWRRWNDWEYWDN